MHSQASRPVRHRLFVYGTLRRASGHPMSRALAHNARRLGPGAIRGRLMRAGPYPAVMADAQGPWIAGDVFEVTGGARFWRVLDAYEGCHETDPVYERRRIPVWLDAGRQGFWISAWCYMMR